MDKSQLKKRLLDFDREVFLTYNETNLKCECYIVGGGAMLIMDLIPRATYDIDILKCTATQLIGLMEKYDMNMNVSAHICNFADDYISRAKKLDLKTYVVDFYVLSLEDLVASKLSSSREKDMEDIRHPNVVSRINWDKLDELVELVKEGLLSDYDVNELEFFYDEYQKEFRK